MIDDSANCINWVVTSLNGESHESFLIRDENIDSSILIEEREELTFNVLKDFYYPIIRQLIDEKCDLKNNEIVSKQAYVDHLEMMDRRHENLMVVKKFLWDEIRRGTKFLRMPCEKDVSRDRFLFHFLQLLIDNNFIFKLHQIPDWKVLYYDYLDFYRLYDSDYLDDDLRIWRDISHAWIDCIYKARSRTVDRMDPSMWKMISCLRDNALGCFGTKVWMIFIVAALVEDEEGLFLDDLRKLKIQDTGEFLKFINSYCKSIENQAIREQRELQCNMVALCKWQIFKKEPSVFSKKTGDVIRALRCVPSLNRKYIASNATGCFATLTCKGEKCFAISGLCDKLYVSSLISEISNCGYRQITLNNNTRYYYNRKEYITYDMYLKYRAKCKEKESTCLGPRLFSCCEKKLLSCLFESTDAGNGYTIYVKFKPCAMCERALTAYEEVSKNHLTVCYPRNARKVKLPKKIGEYDMVARGIRSCR